MLKESFVYKMFAGSKLVGWFFSGLAYAGSFRAKQWAGGSFFFRGFWLKNYWFLWQGSFVFRGLRLLLRGVDHIFDLIGSSLTRGMATSAGKEAADYYLNTMKSSYGKVVCDFLAAFIAVNIVVRLFLKAYSPFSLIALTGLLAGTILCRLYYRQLQEGLKDSRLAGFISWFFSMKD